MQNKIGKKEYILFPNYFKKIGLLIILLTFVVGIVLKMMNIQLASTKNEIFRMLPLSIIIVGLFLIAWSKDKVEDEMTMYIRLNAIAWTFIWTISYVIFQPIAELIVNNQPKNVSGQQIVMTMLIGFIIMFYFLKRRNQ
jgi:hypothetical protein